MKKSIILLVLSVAFITFCYDAQAQKQDKQVSFGFGLESGLTQGDDKAAFPNSGGLTFRLSVNAGPGFATITSGAIAFADPKNVKAIEDALLLIPVRLGYKYIYKKHFFAMGEVGYGQARQYYLDANDDLQKETDGGFILAPSIGVQFGALELSARYESVKVFNVKFSSVGVRLGFNF